METQAFFTKLKSDVALIIAETQSFQNLDKASLNYKSSPSTWSILECFQHLNLYADYYLPEIKNAVEQAQHTNAVRDIAHSWIGSYSIGMMDASNTKKQKTFKRMNPIYSNFDSNVIEKFLNHQHIILNMLDNASLVNVNRKKVHVEFFKLLRMNIAEALEFVIVHERRHMLQAQRIRKSLSLKTSTSLIL